MATLRVPQNYPTLAAALAAANAGDRIEADLYTQNEIATVNDDNLVVARDGVFDLFGRDTTFNTLNLGAGVTRITFGNDGNFILHGNTLDNVIDGNVSNSELHGGDGNDTISIYGYSDQSNTPLGEWGFTKIYGDAGDDKLRGTPFATLYGGEGNDTMDRAGFMYGGIGNDTYIASYISLEWQNYGYSGSVIENENEGIDLVQLSGIPFYVLPAQVENLEMLQFSPFFSGMINLSGNALDNHIDGRMNLMRANGLGGNDVLLGGAGDDELTGDIGIDVLEGGAGNDLLVFDAYDTFVRGGEGFDTGVFAGASATQARAFDMRGNSIELLQWSVNQNLYCRVALRTDP